VRIEQKRTKAKGSPRIQAFNNQSLLFNFVVFCSSVASFRFARLAFSALRFPLGVL
jgi:hypothetical protein